MAINVIFFTIYIQININVDKFVFAQKYKIEFYLDIYHFKIILKKKERDVFRNYFKIKDHKSLN